MFRFLIIITLVFMTMTMNAQSTCTAICTDNYCIIPDCPEGTIISLETEDGLPIGQDGDGVYGTDQNRFYSTPKDFVPQCATLSENLPLVGILHTTNGPVQGLVTKIQPYTKTTSTNTPDTHLPTTYSSPYGLTPGFILENESFIPQYGLSTYPQSNAPSPKIVKASTIIPFYGVDVNVTPTTASVQECHTKECYYRLLGASLQKYFGNGKQFTIVAISGTEDKSQQFIVSSEDTANTWKVEVLRSCGLVDLVKDTEIFNDYIREENRHLEAAIETLAAQGIPKENITVEYLQEFDVWDFLKNLTNNTKDAYGAGGIIYIPIPQ